DRTRLGEPRRTLDEQVPVRQQRDQQALDQVLLADDALADEIAQPEYRFAGRSGSIQNKRAVPNEGGPGHTNMTRLRDSNELRDPREPAEFPPPPQRRGQVSTSYRRVRLYEVET